MKILNHANCFLVQGGACERTEEEGTIHFHCKALKDAQKDLDLARIERRAHNKPIVMIWKDGSDFQKVIINDTYPI